MAMLRLAMPTITLQIGLILLTILASHCATPLKPQLQPIEVQMRTAFKVGPTACLPATRRLTQILSADTTWSG
jgi:hypothetical protein